MSTVNKNVTNTLSHDLISKQDQNVGFFFVSFAIQAYSSKFLLKKSFNFPVFIKHFSDLEIFAVQRVFIKEILFNKLFVEICNEFIKMFIEYDSGSLYPHENFLKKINKGFLLRQIFKQTEQILDKFSFVDNYLNKTSISDNYMENLAKDLANLTVHEKILVLTRVFISLSDITYDNKKTIFTSFMENLKRTKNDYVIHGLEQSKEVENLQMMIVGMNN